MDPKEREQGRSAQSHRSSGYQSVGQCGFGNGEKFGRERQRAGSWNGSAASHSQRGKASIRRHQFRQGISFVASFVIFGDFSCVGAFWSRVVSGDNCEFYW